jgi:hypothetical protein
MAEPEEREPHIRIDSAELRGVWANDVKVIRGEHEFTIDFVRLDHAQQPPEQGALVARVALSSGLLLRLLELLQSMWDDHTRRTLPPDVYGGDEANGEV